jgi:hypothetical protein
VLASPVKTFEANEVKQFLNNNSFYFLDMDSEVALQLIEFINNDEFELAQELIEYQLDIIVCSAWDFKDKLNDPSRKRAMEILHNIKKYRLKGVKRNKSILDRELINKIFPGALNTGIDFNKRSIEILENLK